MIDFSIYTPSDGGQTAGAGAPIRLLPEEAAGSAFLVTVSLDPAPKYPAPGNPQLSITTTGLLQIPLMCTIKSGKFAGYQFFEKLLAPASMQPAGITPKQKTACDIAAQRMRTLLLTARGIKVKDTSEQAKSAAQLSSWGDLRDLVVPVVVGVFNGRPNIEKILEVATADFDNVKAAGELLTDKARAWQPRQGGDPRVPTPQGSYAAGVADDEIWF